MFCTVVVVWATGSRLSGSMPMAIEKVEPLPPPELAAGSSSKLHAPSSSPAATSAAKDLVLIDGFMASRLGYAITGRTSAKWQALGWPWSKRSTSSGSSSAQIGWALGQRVRKLQPDGGF